MKLPHLFYQVHANMIYNAWRTSGMSPIIKIVPQEPFASVETFNSVKDGKIAVVAIRCWNERGMMKCEAASLTDLTTAREWATRHAETPPEEFKWYPEIGAMK